jgi:hypothetical protein
VAECSWDNGDCAECAPGCYHYEVRPSGLWTTHARPHPP